MTNRKKKWAISCHSAMGITAFIFGMFFNAALCFPEVGAIDLPAPETKGTSIVNMTEDFLKRDVKSAYSVPVEKPVQDRSQMSLDNALEAYEASQVQWGEGSFDNAMGLLDKAYSHLLNVDTLKHSELSQSVEDLRFMISRRILEIYAAKYKTVNGFHREIPLVMNDHIQREIAFFQGNYKEFFINATRRSGKYRENIVRRLKAEGLPEELSWLPLIESGFHVRALSPARALGLWQFIPSTGYRYGLQRNSWIDERLDPEKSTDAAIAYLKQLHQMFGDWATVLAAYNCGEMRVLNVIREQKINYLDNFWDLYQRLPMETAQYVPRFFAVLHILKDPEKYGISLDEPDQPLAYEKINVERQVHLKQIAEFSGVSLEELSELNPELRQKLTPTSSYFLKVPPGQGIQVLAKLDAIPQYEQARQKSGSPRSYHIVRKGDTLSTIAKKYGVSVESLANTNGFRSTPSLKKGQSIRIPGKEDVAAATPVTKERSSSGKTSSVNTTYRVKKGDNLWLIAKRFNTDSDAIKDLNGLSSSALSVGQVLKVKD